MTTCLKLSAKSHKAKNRLRELGVFWVVERRDEHARLIFPVSHQGRPDGYKRWLMDRNDPHFDVVEEWEADE